MRVNESYSHRMFLASLESLHDGLESASRRIASGRKISRLSDSPSGAAEVLQLRGRISRIDQYQGNAESTQFFLSIADSALNAAHNLVTSIFTRGSAGAGSLVDPAVRAGIAAEIRSLRDQLLAVANTQAQGRHVFAGSQVTTPAFSISGDSVTYQGDQIVNAIEIAEGFSVRQNVPGSAVFDAAFSRIESLLSAMDSGNHVAIQAELDRFADVLKDIGMGRAQIGVDLGRLQDVAPELGIQKEVVLRRQSHLEDANLAESITELTRIQTALSATLMSRSLTQQRNLFDFLA